MRVFRVLWMAATLGSVFYSAPVQAQGDLAWPEWLEMGGLGGPRQPVSGYNAFFFFDATHGVAAVSGPQIYYIGNASQSQWNRATIPAGFSTVRSIRFIQGTLYAANDGPDVLLSNDSGRTWTFGGLGLGNANDVYTDGSGTIHALHDPMKVFARLDSMHCIAQGTAEIFVSNDGGLTWTSSGVPMVDDASTGAFADPCHMVYVCPNSYGTAFRSTDLGQTWRSVPTGCGTGSEWLAGASTVPYVTSDGGLYRSTDDGVDWVSVYTVTAGPHTPFFVFGPMGEHVVLAWMGSPNGNTTWITSTGGLDDLHGAPSMTDSNGAPLMQEDTMNVPLELTSICQPFYIPVTVESDVDGMTVHASIAKDSLGDFSFPATDTTVSLRKNHEDTLWLRYQPHHAASNIVLQFENHWQCSDWTETRAVHVVTIPAARIAPPPLFAASCRPDTEAAAIEIDSCETLIIDSVAIPASLASQFQLLTPLPLTATNAGGNALRFVFTALGPGTIKDSIEIFGHYLGVDSLLDDYFYFPHAWGDDTDFSSFYTTLPITLRALAASGVALISNDSAITLFRANYCEHELDTSVRFKNKGCTADTILSYSLSGTGYSTPAVTLPIIVPPDSTVTFPIRFYGTDTGSFAGALALEIVSGETKNVAVSLSGVGFPPVGALQANTVFIDAGATNLCDVRDTFVVIRDTGCDSVSISGLTLVGTGWSVLDSGSSKIAPGEADTLRLASQPDTSGRPFSNTATVTVNSDARPPLGAVTFSREIEYPIAWNLQLVISDSGIPGTDQVFKLVQTAQLPPDVTAIDFTLSYDDDLLHFTGSDDSSLVPGNYVRTPDGRAHQDFHLSPVDTTALLATLHFMDYIARHLRTAVTIENISLLSSTGRSSDCIASIVEDSAQFAVAGSCDGPLLSAALRNALALEGIRPNPASNRAELHYSLQASRETPQTLEIEDMLGRLWESQPIALEPGRDHTLSLDLSSLPTGVYLVRIAQQEVKIVKE